MRRRQFLGSLAAATVAAGGIPIWRQANMSEALPLPAGDLSRPLTGVLREMPRWRCSGLAWEKT